jgi:hypothetical protein
MLFTINDPNNYPVYDKSSILNSNPSFDYGPFLTLATDMANKASNNDTTTSFFAY